MLNFSSNIEKYEVRDLLKLISLGQFSLYKHLKNWLKFAIPVKNTAPRWFILHRFSLVFSSWGLHPAITLHLKGQTLLHKP